MSPEETQEESKETQEESTEKSSVPGSKSMKLVDQINVMSPSGVILMIYVLATEIIDILIPECVIDSLLIELILEIPIFILVMMNADMSLGEALKKMTGMIIQERIPIVSYMPSFMGVLTDMLPFDFVTPIYNFFAGK